MSRGFTAAPGCQTTHSANMPLDLNSMWCQSSQFSGCFSVAIRFLGVICFICGVNSDDAMEFQNNCKYVFVCIKITVKSEARKEHILVIIGCSDMFVAVCQLVYVTVTVSTSVGQNLRTSKNFLLVGTSTVTFQKRRSFVTKCDLWQYSHKLTVWSRAFLQHLYFIRLFK